MIADTVSAFDSVTISIRTPRPSNVAPHMTIRWDEERLGMSPAEAKQQLSRGEPRIEISGGKDGLTINPYMMEDGEERIVAPRLREVLTSQS